jgi:hypothetical protein
MADDKGKAGELLLALHDRPGRYAAEVNPKLAPGDHVKLGFRADPALPFESEWMWVEVTATEGVWPATAVYRGELDNTPCCIDPVVLRLGQPVEFRGEHIYEVVHDSPERRGAVRG